MLPKNYIKPTEYAAGGAKKKTKSGSPKPTNPSLWSRAKSLAKQKFDVYPSAYANGWASKWYKENGGGWSGGSNKKVDGGPVNKVNALLQHLAEYDTKMSDSERRFMYQQQLDRRRQDLFNENSRVERVRENVLPAAKELAEISRKIRVQEGQKGQEAWDYFQEMLNPEGETVAERKKSLREKIKNAPELLKQALPDRGSYNLFLLNSDKYEPDRELYCTPYGCFNYQKAGAKDVPTVAGNLGLVSGTKSGNYPFEIIPQQEAQPGDLGLLIDSNTSADYGIENSPLVRRPHHTTIVSETNPEDPNYIKAYNAVGGNRLDFRNTPITAEEIQYLRYVGQTPGMEKGLESDLAAQQAILQDKNILPKMPITGPQEIPNTMNERMLSEINPANVPNSRRGLGSIFPSLRRTKVQMQMGGPVNYQQGGSPNGLMQIQNGGTHEESPLGGVPMGTDAEGNQVLVEEGETVRKGSESDFVFSDRLRLTKQEAEEFAIDKKFVGQTFADISKKLETRSKRKNDPIDNQTIDIQLNRLEEAQEVFKQRKLAEAEEMYGGSKEPSPEQSMEPPMGSPMEGPMGSPMGAQQGPSPEEMAIMQAMQQGAAGMGPQGMGQPSPEMMPPQGPPQMMNYGGLIYANGGPTQNLLEALGANYTTPSGTPLEASSIKDIAYGNYLKTKGLDDYEIKRLQLNGNLENTVNNFYRDSLTTPQSTKSAAAPAVDPQQLENSQMVDAQVLESLYPADYVTPDFSPLMPTPSTIEQILPFLNNRYPQESTQTAPQTAAVSDPNAQSTAAGAVTTPAAVASSPAAATPAASPSPVTSNAAAPPPAAPAAPVANTQGAAAAAGSSPANQPLGPGLDINFEETGGYSTQGGDLVIPSGSSMPFGPLGANPRTQPEIPSYETPFGITAMQAAPVVSNLLTSGMLPEGFNYEDYRVSPDDSIVQKRDITADLQDIDKMTQMGRQAITARATSTGELLVGLSKLSSIGMAEIGKVRSDQYSTYLQELEAQKLRNLQLAQFNSQTKGAVDAANADLEKERLSLINAAATEASKVADALRQENLSKYEIEVLYKMYPYLTQFN